jgi:D-lactate dehydrogenase
MKILMTSTKDFEKRAFEKALVHDDSFEITFSEVALSAETAAIAEGFDVVCVFVSDKLDQPCLEKLKNSGTKLIALRSAGFNHIDLKAAEKLKITVVRVPKYSPEAVAEFTLGLYLCLNRKIHRAHDRVREGNFSLHGLVGHNVCAQTVGIIGAGNIGRCVAQIFRGFGARVLAHDATPNLEWAKKYDIECVDLATLLKSSDVITLHVPLNKLTRHLIDEAALSLVKKGAFIVNTSRGGIIHTAALVEALKTQKISGAALDVYEEEENYFFKDFSDEIINDDALARLMTFPNVLITSHQAFLTEEALHEIALTTLRNIREWEKDGWNENFLTRKL